MCSALSKNAIKNTVKLLNTSAWLCIIVFLSELFFASKVQSQHKFEFGLSADPFVVPINHGTYVEEGLGFYKINGTGKISQSGSAFINYWPFRKFGISIGTSIRNFQSEIDYSIPDPIYKNSGPIIDRTYPFKANGWGPSFSILLRNERWRTRIGLAAIDLYNQKYISNASITAVTIWESSGEIIAHIQADENAYWNIVPSAYGLIQFEGQTVLLPNLFVRLSFETSIGRQYFYPYTLLISGFTPETGTQDQILNDYKMRNKLTSVSLGVSYLIGFGKFKNQNL